MKGLHVVFGASGPLGSTIVQQLADAGENVRAVVRDEERDHCAFPGHVEIVTCDPIHRRHAVEAAAGATTVYRCIRHTFGYSQWGELWLPITENIIAAAHEAGARLVSPGNVYVYGPFQQIPATEDHPLAATGPKGKMRVATQGLLCRANRSGAVRVVIPRLPDLFGPHVLTRFHGGLFRAAVHGEAARWYGHRDVRRSLLFIDDAARACILLGSTESAYGSVWHVPGPDPLTADELIRMVYKAAGRPPRVHGVSALSLKIEGIFDPDVKAFLEFRYRFEQPAVLDGSRFAEAFPDFRYTPYEEAVKTTLAWFKEHGAV